MDMDQLSCGSLCLMAIATILLSLILRQAMGGTKETGPKLPPGPWNLPFIGSLHHLIGMKLPPHRAFLRLSRRHGPLMLLRLGEVPNVIVSTPEAAMEVLKTNDLAFATRPSGPTLDVVSCGGKGLIFAPYGEHWRQMRKVCVMELLSARQVQRIEFIKQGEVAHLVESVAAASPSGSPIIDVGKGLTKLSNNIIARAVFGGKCRQQEEYLRELDTVSMLVGGFSPVDLFPSSRLVRWLSSAARDVRRSHARVQRILGDIIQERKEKKPSNGSAGGRDDEDLLDVLLRLHKEDTLGFPLTSEIIGAVVFDIFGAATDTTAATLEWAMAELIRSPHAMARAKLEVRQKKLGHGRGSTVTSADLGDLHYLRMVVKETLRLHPSAALIHRASQESCRVMGYDIPKGTAVTINAFAVGRDPVHWGEDAAEFRPERFEEELSTVEYRQGPQMEFIPFGAGRRQCPGALFATTTIELVLANLLYHFDWTVPGGETLDMGEVFGIIVHTRSSLRLQAVVGRHLQDR
ncbi:zealexin A1 synthase-like [Triticum dicoccoides]|uniref:zealexin A1 synthase-like n=1 Tax=Triticum dicoccoides TaxID=85692 RepID=UPI00189010AD|nr:zealexin A1 synthase-like [Triticum dicoccoides]